MHAISFRYVKFLPLYKAFKLSVQGQCTKSTRVYKGVYLTFSKRGEQSSHMLLDNTRIACNLIDVYHVHSSY